MRAFLAGVALLLLIGCGSHKGGGGGDDDGGGEPDSGVEPCVGLQCQIVDCAKDGKPSTTLTGVVHAPNGTLPLYGVNVYVPRDEVPAFTEGAQCSRCGDTLPGTPLTSVKTDEAGRFRLVDVPAGANIPLVIATGKWRREIRIPTVTACAESQLLPVETRLPRTKAEGHIPKIALTTGLGDALECLIRKLGIDDSEVTTDAGTGRIHFYHGTGSPLTELNNGGVILPEATTLWGSEAKLRQYDMVFLSCEGYQNGQTKPLEAMLAVKAYADAGGRVFASHWHNIWIGGNFVVGGNTYPRPPVWSTLATWETNENVNGDPGNPILIDEDPSSNPKGAAFATWMLNVKGTGLESETGIGPDTTRGQISVEDLTGRVSALSLLAPDRVERWVYTQGQNTPQMFQFTTPLEVQVGERCGKVVFSDMHVSGDPQGGGYPAACPDMDLTPQEKALAFMFFDIASCVGPIF